MKSLFLPRWPFSHTQSRKNNSAGVYFGLLWVSLIITAEVPPTPHTPTVLRHSPPPTNDPTPRLKPHTVSLILSPPLTKVKPHTVYCLFALFKGLLLFDHFRVGCIFALSLIFANFVAPPPDLSSTQFTVCLRFFRASFS